jgi:hypothetical protein
VWCQCNNLPPAETVWVATLQLGGALMTRLWFVSPCLVRCARGLTMASSLALSITWFLEPRGGTLSGVASASAAATAPSLTRGGRT